jgi:hypothetical protein
VNALERQILTTLQGEDAPKTEAAIGRLISARTSDVKAAIRALRWRGFIAWDRLTIAGRDAGQYGCQNGADCPGEETGIAPPKNDMSDKAAAGALGEGATTVHGIASTSRPPRKLHIGDVEPLPADWSREAWQRQRKMQVTCGSVGRKGGVAAKILAREQAKIAAEKQRAMEPIEQAKTIMRRRGFSVYAADVIDPKTKGFIVGTRLLSFDELLVEAGLEMPKKSGRPKRRGGEASAP